MGYFLTLVVVAVVSLVVGALAGFLAAKLAKPTTLVGKMGAEVGKAAGR